DLVAELGTEHLEGRLVERLGRRGHLTEVEQDRHQGARLHRVAAQRLDLVGEVGDGGAAAQADDLAAALLDVDAADDRGIPHLEFLALRATRLALLRLAAALAECARGAAAGTPAAASAGTASEPGTAGAREAAASAGPAGAAGALLERRAGAPGAGAAGTRSARSRCAGARRLRTRDV